MKIKSYNLFLESNSYLLDDKTIKNVKKIFLDRLEGEIIDGVELSIFEPDPIIIFQKIRKNQFGFYKINKESWSSYENLMVIITCTTESILPYLKLIKDEIIELGLDTNLTKVNRTKRSYDEPQRLEYWKFLICR
jgi:hypothetical protein